MQNFIIYVNGIALNEIGGAYFLDRVQGLLDIPEIRTSSYHLSGLDGGRVPRQFYGMRDIGLNGRMFGVNAADTEEKRKALIAAIASKDLEIKVVTFAGHAYLIKANLTGFRADIDNDSKRKATFLLQAIAPDPLLYDDIEAEVIAVVARKTSGGYPTPYTLPVTWNPATQPTNVINSGNAAIKPVIEITGSATNPRITNITSGRFIQVNISKVEGDELLIDLKDRSIMLNGGNIVSMRETGSEWFELGVDDNLLELTTNSDSDTASALVKYRSGYIGA